MSEVINIERDLINYLPGKIGCEVKPPGGGEEVLWLT